MPTKRNDNLRTAPVNTSLYIGHESYNASPDAPTERTDREKA